MPVTSRLIEKMQIFVQLVAINSKIDEKKSTCQAIILLVTVACATRQRVVIRVAKIFDFFGIRKFYLQLEMVFGDKTNPFFCFRKIKTNKEGDFFQENGPRVVSFSEKTLSDLNLVCCRFLFFVWQQVPLFFQVPLSVLFCGLHFNRGKQ